MNPPVPDDVNGVTFSYWSALAHVGRESWYIGLRINEGYFIRNLYESRPQHRGLDAHEFIQTCNTLGIKLSPSFYETFDIHD